MANNDIEIEIEANLSGVSRQYVDTELLKKVDKTSVTDSIGENPSGNKITSDKAVAKAVSQAKENLEGQIAEQETEMDGKINAVQSSVNAEVTERKKENIRIEAVIASNKQTAESSISTLNTTVNTNKANTDQAIANLNSTINSKEQALDAKITAETNSRTASEEQIYTYINGKISAAIIFKGSVSTYNNLPQTGQKVGDMYNCEDTGKNYAWDGYSWDDLGGTFDASAITADINKNKADIATLNSQVTTISGNVTTAQATATQASTDANLAKTTAEQAQTTANAISATASQAQTTANEAKTTADSASSSVSTLSTNLATLEEKVDTIIETGGEVTSATNVLLSEIEGLSASNAQEGLEEINNEINLKENNQEIVYSLIDGNRNILHSINKDGTSYFPSIKAGKGLRQSDTIYVAASDSNDIDKAFADIVCDGENDVDIINKAIYDINFYGTVMFLCGTYYINKFTAPSDSDAPAYYAIRTGLGDNATRCKVILKGAIQQRYWSLGDTNNGVNFVVTQACYDTLNTTDYYAIISGGEGGGKGYQTRAMKNECEVNNIFFSLPNNQKNIICIDGINIGALSVFHCKGNGYGANNRHTNPIRLGVPGCIGIRGHRGGNNGGETLWFSNTFTSFGVAYSVQGEHIVLIQCEAIGNTYSFYFNQFLYYGGGVGGSTYAHGNTLINCADEVSANGIYFGENIMLQDIDFVSYTIEYHDPNRALFTTNKYAKEHTPGQWGGHLSYDITYSVDGEYIYANRKNIPFWENDGSGKKFISCNNAQDKIADKATIKTFSANYNQMVYCTDENKPIICVNPNTGEWRDFTGNIVSLD